MRTIPGATKITWSGKREGTLTRKLADSGVDHADARNQDVVDNLKANRPRTFS